MLGARFSQLLWASLILVMACAIAFSPDDFLPMMARSFALWWCVGLAGVLLLAFWKRRAWIAMSSGLGVALVLPLIHVPSQQSLLVPGAGGLRIAHLNVLQPNMQHEEVIAAVLRTDADLISVQEVSPEWAAVLRASLGRLFPHQLIAPRSDCYGIALLSRRPLRQARIITMAGAPLIEAEVELDGSPVRIFTVHASSPGGYGHFRRRNAQLAELAHRIASSMQPTVIVGDLNTVHWDDAYRRFCAVSGARPMNSPLTATWPAIGPLALIPLDHVLVAGGLEPVGISTFPIAGSDHRGLLAGIRLAHAS
ncbi:MAG: endonuclease/exonuclease/phosphatase family protein [Flavobacteriales bacterium]|nr:endonuclease/exonuclease/phosphatase family protein [Flavobacteriales bacterium]